LITKLLHHHCTTKQDIKKFNINAKHCTQKKLDKDELGKKDEREDGEEKRERGSRAFFHTLGIN